MTKLNSYFKFTTLELEKKYKIRFITDRININRTEKETRDKAYA